jgi:hypothetical protein
MARETVHISYACEGPTDAAVARRLISHVGATPGKSYGGSGKTHLLSRLRGYAAAAEHSPWLVLVDLDRPNPKDDCVVAFRNKHLRQVPCRLCLRVAVREVEAWLLADSDRFASYFAVSRNRVPKQPESLDDPKAALIEAARRSSRREVREDLVPADRGTQLVGPGYTSRIVSYASDTTHGWRPERAAEAADSLARAIHCLERLVVMALNGR